MRRILFAAAAVFLSLSAAQGQNLISLDESRIRALPGGDSSVISIPFASNADRPLQAELALSWVGWDDRESNPVRRPVTIQPGQSTIETVLPLSSSSIWMRLRYSVSPGRSNVRAFGVLQGTLSIAHISDYVFELRASHTGQARHGAPITVHAQAVHPISRVPLKDVEWKATLSIDGDEIAPKSMSLAEEGFAGFTFEIPSGQRDDPGGEATVEISARKADFEQGVSLTLPVPSRLSARFQTDKPIYQPGQVIHLRAVVLDARGRAAPGAEVTLRIDDPGNERVRTVSLVASRSGVVQQDWLIPPSSPLGVYRLSLTAKGDEMYHIAGHSVRVSRYDLPVFRVEAKPDRAAYLPDEKAEVSVQGRYLFGRPVPKGRVKIVRSRGPQWSPSRRKTESDEEVLASGEADDDGTFIARLDLQPDHDWLRGQGEQRFADLHFAAYYTDPQTGRTEQRRFDLRITREPIHVYVIRTVGFDSLPSPVYVATSYADGRPAPATVDLQYQGKSTRFTTNRYGAGKTMLIGREGLERELTVQASDGSGRTGRWRERYWWMRPDRARLDTSRTIHSPGQPVTLRVTFPAEAPADQTVLIHAIAKDRRVAARAVKLNGHEGEVTFPYQPDFQGSLVFVAWNASDRRGSGGSGVLGSRTVFYPERSDLTLTATSEKPVYKPGEKASLRMRVASQDGRPVQAALGLAVVDQAVLERAETDGEFGRRPWFACAFCRDESEVEIGGIRLADLLGLRPGTPVTAELDLVAEAHAARSSAFVMSKSSEYISSRPPFPSLQRQADNISAALDRHYANSLEIPENSSALYRVIGRIPQDPWGKQYAVEFSVHRGNRVITLMSEGPDRRLGTADDFAAATFPRPYFTPVRRLMAEALAKVTDYPASETEFVRLLSSHGLLLESLRDPWGTPYSSRVRTDRATRIISILCAGPDKTFTTGDDFTVAAFTGGYFLREKARIQEALAKATPAPSTIEAFRQTLAAAGIDMARYLDAWGHPYRISNAIASSYDDRRVSSTSRVFGGTTQTRTAMIPVSRTYLNFSLRSAGEDGVEDSPDDFDIARFPVLLAEEDGARLEANRSRPADGLRGSGSISGRVVDQAEGVIPNAKMILRDAAGMEYETSTDVEGAFHFTSLPAGAYTLSAAATGFTMDEVTQIPVEPARTTTVDFELRVGSVAETVTVEASVELVQTQAASANATATGTPRVREYFPETLFWNPELLTSADGAAIQQFALADSVTTWKVAVFASTMDGRTAEAESEFQTFQPFFLDFNPPSVLTEGDQIELPVTIRNYQKRPQSVTLSMHPNRWSTFRGESARQVQVPANSSLNVSYTVQAGRATDKAPQRVSAAAGRARDAIEKSSRVRVDGQEVVQALGDLLVGKTSLAVSIPTAAAPEAMRAELRVYPNITSLLMESADAILATPHGCAEQTVSAGYANLVALRFARTMVAADSRMEERALANIRIAVDSLSAYRDQGGGFRYWSNGQPDLAVTAHALGFLLSASRVSPVSRGELRQIVAWLEKSQSSDGRWLAWGEAEDGAGRKLLTLTALVARSLSEAHKAGIPVSGVALAGAYRHLAQFTDQTDEPYLLANFILAALDSGDEALLGDAVVRLAGMARQEHGAVYWDMRTNTPFYGWGRAARYETTGLAVSALAAWRTGHPEAAHLDPLIRRGLVFLLRGRNAAGIWDSTQSTIRAMRAIADASSVLGALGGSGGTLDVRSNGRLVKSLALTADSKSTDPILLDLSSFLKSGDNEFSLSLPAPTVALVRLTSAHWLPWKQTAPRTSPELSFGVEFDRLRVTLGEPVRCRVKAKRAGFKGYGMMLAEIGLPPGADVDRSSLQSAVEDGAQGLDHYEVLPDRVVLYLWPKAGGAEVNFYLTPRIAMIAKSVPSVLYDYYNPEAVTEVAPVLWTVK